MLPRALLVRIYKWFVFNNSFHERPKSTQYNAALAITGTIRATSREKLYQELGFEYLVFFQDNKKLISPVPP